MEFLDHNINLLDGLLWLTGGLLERLKTTYSIMVWKFEADNVPPDTVFPRRNYSPANFYVNE
eukprot:1400564-Ditylum_brightwellii.AAC.1